MSDGVVAAEADQRIARLERAPHIALDHDPRVARVVELDITVIHEPARSAEVDAGLAPYAAGVGVQLAADQRRRLRGASQEGGVGVVWDAQEGDMDHLGFRRYRADTRRSTSMN
jgi:hypothetical protein